MSQRAGARTRITARNQATLPAAALKQAGLKAGDELRVEAMGPGRLVLIRAADVVRRHAGRLTGVYPRTYLSRLRGEWR